MKTELEACPRCGQELERPDPRSGATHECPHCAETLAGREVEEPGRPAAGDSSAHRRLRCTHHPTAAAIRRCELCHDLLCSTCVIHRYVNHARVEMCPCGGRVHRLTPLERGIAPVTFHETLGTAFGYPFKGQGGAMLFLGTLFLSGVSLLIRVPILGWAFLGLTAAYMAAFLTKIIFTTALGGDEAPEWPELARMWTNVFKPFVLLAIAAAVCAGPAAGWWYYREGAFDAIVWILAGGGALLFPMALACIAVTGSPIALNPFLWLETLGKAPAEYLLACFTFFLAAGLKVAGEILATQIPYGGTVVGSFLLLYFLMVEMRILGLTFQANREKIGWF